MKITNYPEYSSNPFTDIPPITSKEYSIIMGVKENEKPINYMAYNYMLILDTHATIGLALHLAHHKLVGDNEVEIHIELFKQVTGKKGKATYYRSIQELLEKQIIARKKYHKNMFYVNPKYIRSYYSINQ